MRNKLRVAPPGSETSKRQTRKFCSTRPYFIEDKEKGNPHRNSRREINFPINPMKTLLIASLCSVTLALTSFGQPPPPPPPVTAPASPSAAVATPAVAMSPAVAGLTPVPGMTPLTAVSPAVAATTSTPAAFPTPTPMSEADKNFFIHNFKQGGPIMWPILLVSLTALAVVIERVFWWLGRWMRRDPKRIEKVFTAIEVGDVAEASRLSRDSRDPVLRMMWNGLNHQHASLQGALQVAAGIEIKRAGRFLVVMDTLVTLAPLLGLLGTITGLMRSFASLGNDELAVQAVTGGIAEALIATACGLGIAIFSLFPLIFSLLECLTWSSNYRLRQQTWKSCWKLKTRRRGK